MARRFYALTALVLTSVAAFACSSEAEHTGGSGGAVPSTGGTIGSGGSATASGGASGAAKGGSGGANQSGGGTGGSTICTAAASDNACDSCSKSKCCPALTSFSGSMDAAAFNTCASPCTDSACTEACVTRYPTAGAAFHTVSSCRFDSCGPECACGAKAQDTACTACAKVQCCAEYAKYNAAPGVTEFSACIAPCKDQACIDACATSHPEVGAAYRTLSTCLTGSCKTPCTG